MIKFKEFLLLEEDNSKQFKAFDKVLSGCKDFIDTNKSKILDGKFLFRQMDDSSETNYGILKKQVRKDRRPRDTVAGMHTIFDGYFEKKFGKKYRSGAMFCQASNIWGDDAYGPHRYMVFPVGSYDICYSKQIKDLVVLDPHVGDELYPSMLNLITKTKRFGSKDSNAKANIYFVVFADSLFYNLYGRTQDENQSVETFIDNLDISSIRRDTMRDNINKLGIGLDNNFNVPLIDLIKQFGFKTVKEFYDSFDDTMYAVMDTYKYKETKLIDNSGRYELMVMCDNYVAIPVKYKKLLTQYFNEKLK